MSDDSLLREIDEDLRQDQLKALWKRYGTLITSVAAAVVIGVAGFNGWSHWQTQQRLEQTAVLDAAIDEATLQTATGDAAKQIADRLAGDIEKLAGGTAILARLYQAAALAKAGDAAAAVRAYEQVAADSQLTPALRDLARILGLAHSIGTVDDAQVQATLAPLAADSSPWRFTARELQAVLALKSGDRAKAHELYAALAEAPETPRGLRSRARDLVAQLAGSGS